MLEEKIVLLQKQLEEERAARLDAERRLSELSLTLGSEQAHSQAELAGERLLLQALMRYVPDHIYFKDRDSRFILVSEAMAKLFGLNDTAGVIGKTDFDFFTQEHAQQARDDELVIMASGQSITIEEMETWPDQPETWVSTTKVPLRDADGTIVGTFGISRDITERKKAEQSLRESEARFRNFFDKNSSVLLLTDPATGKIVEANAAATDYYGYPPGRLVGMSMSNINVMAMDNLLEEGQRAIREECNFFYFTHRLANGEMRNVEVHLTPIESNGRLLLFSICHDITERRQAEAKLRMAAAVFTHAREGILITSPTGSIVDVNDAFTTITGYRREEVMGRNPSLLSSGRHDKAFYSGMWRALIERGQWYGEIWNRRKDGQVYPEMLTISAVRDVQGETLQYVALFSDITRIKEHERALEQVAHYDALTGLPNRVLLADRLEHAMTQAARRGQRLAVVYLDLDEFKLINDRYGHEVGDRVLTAVTARMKQTLREEDTLARVGGDEFVALLADHADGPMMNSTFTRLLAAAMEPVYLGDLNLQISASLGATFYPQERDVEADVLLSQADQAMYQAKLEGKNRYCLFLEGVVK